MWDGEEIYPFLSEIELEKGCSIIKYLQFFSYIKFLSRMKISLDVFFCKRKCVKNLLINNLEKICVSLKHIHN